MDNAINEFIGVIINSLNNLIDYLLLYAGAIIVVIIIYGGIQYITDGTKGGEAGKKTIIAALVGLIIIGLAWVIIDMVANRII